MFNREIIAIAGGGSVGVSFLVQIINETIKHQNMDRIELLMFDPQNIAGPGYAYQEDYASNLLNTRADTMSAIESERKHFINWLHQNEKSWRPDFPNVRVDDTAFLPRSLFGRYLAATFRECIQIASMYGIPFRLIKDSVEDIVPLHNGQYCVDTSHSGAYYASRVVVCIGNMGSTNFPGLVGKPNFYNNPYPGNKFSRVVPKDASICVLV